MATRAESLAYFSQNVRFFSGLFCTDFILKVSLLVLFYLARLFHGASFKRFE